MVQDLSSPNSITVIAIEVISSPDNPATTQMGFDRTLAMLSSLGAVTSDANALGATVGLEPDAEIPSVMLRLDSIVADFEERCVPARLRALVHYGTAFRAKSADGAIIFQGSAVRSAGNSLKRSSLPSGIYSTPDFSNFVAMLKGAMGFEVQKSELPGFCRISIAVHRPASTSHELHSTDPDLVDWLKARLAKDLGPFASALIDNASHSTRTAKELAAAVGHEIVNPRARQRFDADVFNYIQTRGF